MAGQKVKAHVCFTVGAAVPWEKAVLFGNMLAEPPIVLDYLKQTSGKGATLATAILAMLPMGPLSPERDWWDEGPLTERVQSYRKILVARRHGLRASQLDEVVKGKIPDLLTYKGLSAAELGLGFVGRGSRHEFYEIKPRSASGLEQGMKKVAALKKAYGNNGLPYLPGLLYPTHFYPPDGITELPLLVMDKRHKSDWNRALKIVLKRVKLADAKLTLEVRPAPQVPGLLLYRICVTLEYPEENELSDALVIHTARELVNAYVMSSVVDLPDELQLELGAVARALVPALLERQGRRLTEFALWQPPRDVQFPMIDIELVSGLDMIRPALPEVRRAMNSRHVGIPGERFMLCCDEAFYQAAIAPLSALQIAQYLRLTPARWADYLRRQMALQNVVQEASDVYDLGKAAANAASKPLVDWAGKHPGQAVLIGVGVIVVTALAFWALPALAAELAALEAASLAASSGAISGTFIETAAMSGALMESATTLELAAAANLHLDAAVLAAANAAEVAAIEAEAAAIASATAVPAAGTAAVLATTAEAALLRQTATVVGRRIVAEALKHGAASGGGGALAAAGGVGITIMLACQTAFAAPSAANRVKGGPVPPPDSFDEVIASMASRLFAVRPPPPSAPPLPGLSSGERRVPRIGERVNIALYSPEAAAQLAATGQKAHWCYYLGELLVK